MCVDTEYDKNGADGLLLEIGHVIVHDGQVVDRKNFVLDWYRSNIFSSVELDQRVRSIADRVGFPWRLTPQVIRTEGIDPIKVIQFYDKLFRIWNERKGFFVLQNGRSADEVLFRSHFERYLRKSFEFPHDNYIDTGLLGKAYQIWHDDTHSRFRELVLPQANETPRHFFSRIAGIRAKGVRWQLSSLLNRFGVLQERDFDEKNSHCAVNDAEYLQWLMDRYGQYYPAMEPVNLPVAEVAQDLSNDLDLGSFRGYAPGEDPTDSGTSVRILQRRV